MTIGLAIALVLRLALGIGVLNSLRNAVTAFSGRDPYADAGDGVMEIVIALVLVVCLLGVVAVYRYEPGPTFQLTRADWTCSRSHVVRDDDGDYSVCDQYSRR